MTINEPIPRPVRPMRLPAPSYAVESVLGAAVVILAVIVLAADLPSRPRPVAQ